MPHHKSAEKRLRQTEKRTIINRARIGRVRTFVKKVETAIETGDRAAAQSALQLAQPELHRATTKGVLHKNTVARKLSRLATPINAPWPGASDRASQGRARGFLRVCAMALKICFRSCFVPLPRF